MSLQGRVPSHAVNPLILLSANALGFVASFILPLLLVRFLIVLDYGLFKQSFLLINIVVYLLPFGYAASAFYFLPRQGPDGQGKVIMNIVCTHATVGLIAFATLLAWPGSLSLLFGGSDLVGVAPLIAAVILLWSTARLSEVITIAHGEMKFAAFFILFGQVSKAVFLIVAASQYGTLRALLIASIIQGVVQNIGLLLYLVSRFPGFWRKFSFPLMRDQLVYSLPLGSAALLYSAMTELPGFFVSHKFGAESYAIYTVGLFLIPLVNVCVEPIGAAVLRPVCDLQRSGNKRQIAEALSSATQILAVLLFPISALMWITGAEWIEVLFTSQYRESIPILYIALLMVPLRAAVTDPVIKSFSQHRFFPLKIRFFILLFMLPAMALTPVALGPTAIVAAVTMAFIVDKLLELWKAWRILDLGFKDVRLFKPIAIVALCALSAAAMTLALRTVLPSGPPAYVAVVASTSFFVIYLSTIFLFGVVPTAVIGRVRQTIVGGRDVLFGSQKIR